MVSLDEKPLCRSFNGHFNTFLVDEMTDSMMQKQADMPPPPEWVVVGESVLIRPYNTSGVIGFVGPTHFQVISLKFFSNLQIIISIFSGWNLGWS